MTKTELFQEEKIRKTLHNGEWFFCVNDVVQVLTNSTDVKQYVKRLKQRDEELNKGWVQFVLLLYIETKGGKQKLSCANLEGCFRIIQSIPSPKAEPFKQWLAKVGAERIDEMENPELAQERMMDIYRAKGYDEGWIKTRIQTIIARNKLTAEWKNRGASEEDYAIFTAIMSKATFDIKPSEHKALKGLQRENLRDNMTDVELALVNLGEVTAREIHRTNNTRGKNLLAKDVKDAGKIAGDAKRSIEKKTGKPVVSGENYLHLREEKDLSINE